MKIRRDKLDAAIENFEQLIRNNSFQRIAIAEGSRSQSPSSFGRLKKDFRSGS